ncbi:transporter [Vibrio anguillarum]|uniref:transporter n=1 Tax=Vibrio TaxID=662 RepID=UPI0015960913|nr:MULTISPECIES: transporter [Vibrio]MCC4234928.1 transporter [Vibrio anguillarum]MDT3846469.1 transporter [Vibrio anguillarum]
MNTQERTRVVFDYTTFLGASCNKKWTFLEAMTSFAPIFGTVWKDSIKELSSPEDRLWEMALKSLSTRRSDEANLISLVRLAKLEGIEELKLVMPYALDSEQIQLIQNKSQSLIKNTKPDEFLITL